MEENIANARTISSGDGSNRPSMMRKIEQLLVHIVKKIGGKLHLELVDHIVQHLTGRNLSALVDARKEENILEYISNNLPPDSRLVVNLEEESVSLECDVLTLDCSAELKDSLVQVKNQIKVSRDITELDLSRHSFASTTELLEVCECARMLNKLILRDIQIEACSEETSVHPSLIERIKWHCPSLEEVDVTGCSPSVLDALFQTRRNPSGRTFGVNVVDLLSSKPEAKELLMPPQITSDVSDIANRIKILVQEGFPANISYDGWSFLHTASIIGDAELVRWLLDKRSRHKNHIVNSKRPTALDVAIECHDATIVEQLLHETDHVHPAKLVDLCFLSQLLPKEEHDVLHTKHSCDCNPLKVVQLFIKDKPSDYNASLLVEFIKGFQRTTPKELRAKTCWTEESLSDMFNSLVSSGVSPNIPIKDLGGKTPLMCAVSSPVLVKRLLNLGSSIHAVDAVGNTALFYAVAEATVETEDEHFDSSKILLENDADVNVKNKCGETPLLFDVSNGKKWSEGSNLQIWGLLVQSGADISVQNKERKSLMHLVVERTKTDLEELSNTCLVEEIATLSQTAVTNAIQQIKFLSKHNSKLVMSRDSVGNTPLHLVADHNVTYTKEMLSIAEALVETGSKVKVANDQGRTPLHLATSWSMAEFLLKQGAKPNVTDDMGCTPMLCRAKETNVEKTHLLDTLSKCSEGLKFGMDPWKEDNDGQNVFQVLMKRTKFDELKNLIEASINNDRESILRTDSKGNSLLHGLCRHNDPKVIPLIDCLLKNGAVVNGQNNDGDTALHIICRYIVRLPQQKREKLRKAITKLRAYGADRNLTNNRKFTPRNIVHFDKKLRKAIDRNVRQREPQTIYPWREQSQNHHGLLSAAARGQNCQRIWNYCYNLQPIGSGAFSNVFAAINVEDGREVALKRTDPYRLNTRQDEREVSNLLELSDCPHVVRYIHFKKEVAFTWIVLELMEGTLNDLLLHGISQDVYPTLCKDFLLGVAYLHSNNILHRDIKPSNVLYSNVPRLCLKIADFGLSKKLGGVQGSSVLHSNAGSRFWMAPELLLSTGHLQHTYASDVFTSGLIMHYMLAERRHPFQGNTCLSIADWNAVEANISVGSKTLSPDLSAEGKDLVAHLLSHNSDDRPKASDALKHPFFWSQDKKVHFLRAVANQSEIGAFGGCGTLPTPVELEIQNNLTSMFHPSWDSLFPAVYAEMTSSLRGRRYDTSSGVHLVRFIRNAYAHVSDRSRPTSFQKLLLEDRIFFRTLPSLFMVIFKAVENGNWHTSREEIRAVINSDD